MKPAPSRVEAYGRLLAVSLRVRKDADEHLIGVGLTSVELVILRQHANANVLSTRDLAWMMRYSQKHIANLVRGLVHRGFLERVPQPRDRRAFPTRLTEKGRDLHDEAHTASDVGIAFEDVKKKGRRHTYRTLKRIRSVDAHFARGATGKTRAVLRDETIVRREGAGALAYRPRPAARRGNSRSARRTIAASDHDAFDAIMREIVEAAVEPSRIDPPAPATLDATPDATPNDTS